MSASGRTAGLLAAALALGGGGGAGAQERGFAAEWSPRVEIGGEIEREDTRTSGRPDRSFDEQRLREVFGLDAVGWGFRPGVLRFRIGGDIGLRNEWLDASDDNVDDNHGRVLDYDGALDLLPDMPISFMLSGSRYEDRDSQGFGADTEVSGESRAGLMRLQDPFGRLPWLDRFRFPSTFAWRRIATVSETLGVQPTERNEVRDILSYDGSYTAPFTQFRVNLRDEDVGDRSFPPIGDYRVREGRASLSTRWGEYLEHLFQASGGAFERAGNFDRDSSSANALYRWDATETLTTQLRYSYDRFETDAGGISRFHNASWNIYHELYESLTTSLRFSGERIRQTGGVFKQYGGGLNLDYRKDFWWGSRLEADLSLDRDIEDAELENARIDVRGEQVRMLALDEVELSNTRVDAGTLLVTDQAGNPLVEGIDYEVIEEGLRTSLLTILGGAITPPEVVLVDYTYATPPDARVLDDDVGFGLGWDLGWLSLRFQHRQTDERLLDGDQEAEGFLQDSRIDDFRVRVERETRRVRAFLEYSFERERSTTLDRDQWGLSENLFWRANPRLTFRVSLRQGQSEVKDSGRTTDLLSGTSSLDWRMGRDRRARLFVRFRRRDDSAAQDQLELYLGMRAELGFGRLRVVPSFTWDLRDRDPSRVTQLRGGLRLIWSI